MSHRRPIVAVLLPQDTREECFSERDWLNLKKEAALQVLPEGPLQEASIQAMAQAHVVLTGWGSPALTEAVLAPAPDLKLWVHAAGSMAPFVSESLWQRGLTMSTSNDVLARGVAEYALGLTLIALKQVVPLAEGLRSQKRWSREGALFPIRELCDMTIGILGFGRVARHLSSLLRVFRGIDIVAYDPFVPDSLLASHGVSRVGLDELFERASVVHNCIPATEKTKGLITARHFQSMRDDAIFINTGRGMTMDQDALLSELRKGRIYACLDVTDPEEPPPDGSPLFSLPNILLTPHIAGAMGNGRKLLGRFAVEEILRFLAGEPLQGELARRDIETMTGGPGIQ